MTSHARGVTSRVTNHRQGPHEWKEQHTMVYKEIQPTVMLYEIHLPVNLIEIEVLAKPDNKLQK